MGAVDPILTARGLIKTYGKKRVVDALDLDCVQGTVLGLLGPNGAGKTTTLRMLYGFADPDAGAITYEGKDFVSHRTAIKRIIGVCTQEDTLDYDFNVEQNLTTYAKYFHPRPLGLANRVAELIDRFGLREYAKFGPRELSGGFRRRLMIARAIVHCPRVLFLDEPTTGLDPKARVDVWELIDKMRSDGMAIILTTHYMDEAERLSDQLLVLSEGKALAHGTPRAILGELLGEHVVSVAAESPERTAIEHWLRTEGCNNSWVVLGERRIAVSTTRLAALTARFAEAKFTVRPPNLDDLFLLLSKDASSP